MKKINVLLLDGDGTQTLPIAESLSKISHTIHMFYTHKLSYGYATKYVNKKIQLREQSESNYLKFVEKYIKENNINVIIPLSDSKAQFISKFKTSLQEISSIFIPDYPIFQMGYDKNKLMAVCQKNNIPHPRTIDLELTDYLEIDSSIFPAIIKPNYTTGGRGMKLVNSKYELELYYSSIKKIYGSCHLQEFIQPGGRQFKVQLFVNAESDLIYSSVIYKQRYYPIEGGSSSCNITIDCPKLVEICHNVLRTINWVGFADFDLIEDPKDGFSKIMEINPRIPACIKSALKSGINYAELIVDASLGHDLKDYSYTPGKSLRHIGFEFLWFLNSPDRWKTKPNWFKFWGKNLSFQDFSWSDPLPFFYGTLGNIKQLLNSEFRKSKSI